MNETLNYVLVIYLWVAIGTQIGFIFYYYIKFFYEFLAGNSLSWNPKFDRLLLTCSFIFLIGSIFLYLQIMNENSWWRVTLYMFVISIFTLLIIVIFRYGTKESKSQNIVHVNNSKSKKLQNFGEMISDKIKSNIYFNFKTYSLINDDLLLEEFQNKFLKEPIELNMGVPAFREFFNLLLKNEKELKGLKPSKFCELFINSKTNKTFDINQFGKTQYPVSNISEELHRVFECIDK